MAGKLSIRELARRSETPLPTIRHYLRLGVLPDASASDGGFDRTHVRALRLVRAIRAERRMPLGDIAAILPDLLRLDPRAARSPRTWDEVARARLDPARLPKVRITRAAVRAFARYGYAAVSMEQVAREAGAAKGSLYRHFRSKDALFVEAAHAVARDAVEALRRAIAAGARTRADLVRALAEGIGERGSILLDLASAATRQRSRRERAARSVLAWLAREVDAALPPHTRGSGREIVGSALAWLIASLAEPPAG